MEIQATAHLAVTINPVDVIKKLIEKEVGSRAIFQKEGKFYEGVIGSFEIEITQEKYDFIKALLLIFENLTK